MKKWTIFLAAIAAMVFCGFSMSRKKDEDIKILIQNRDGSQTFVTCDLKSFRTVYRTCGGRTARSSHQFDASTTLADLADTQKEFDEMTRMILVKKLWSDVEDLKWGRKNALMAEFAEKEIRAAIKGKKTDWLELNISSIQLTEFVRQAKVHKWRQDVKKIKEGIMPYSSWIVDEIKFAVDSANTSWLELGIEENEFSKLASLPFPKI